MQIQIINKIKKLFLTQTWSEPRAPFSRDIDNISESDVKLTHLLCIYNNLISHNKEPNIMQFRSKLTPLSGNLYKPTNKMKNFFVKNRSIIYVCIYVNEDQ